MWFPSCFLKQKTLYGNPTLPARALLRAIFHLHNILDTLFISLLFIANLTINIISFILRDNLSMHVIQTFRLYVHLYYFMIGGLLYKYKDTLVDKISLKANIILIVILIVAANALAYVLEKKIFNFFACEYYYSYIIVVLCSVSLFILLLRLNITKGKFVILKLSSLSMLVYCVHYFVITIDYKLLSMINLSMTNYMVYANFLIVLIGSFAIAYVINEIPVISRLFKL